MRRRLQDQNGSGTSTIQRIDKRNDAHKKNAQTVRDRNTAADIAEAAADGDDDDEKGKSEEGETEHEDKDGEGGGGQRTQLQKRRPARSFYFPQNLSCHGDTGTYQHIDRCL